MSKHLNPRQLHAIEKVGDCMIPGDSELPRFSRTGCVSQVDRILDYMPESDLGDLKMLLGILAFFHGNPEPLLAVAVIVFGGTLLLGGLSATQVQSRPAEGGTAAAATITVPGIFSGQFLVGVGAVVLGILAVIGMTPMILTLVALLSLGAVMLLGQFRT